MNKSQNPHKTFLQFMLRAQHLSKHDARSDKGYAMMMTAIISIVMFSLLGVYLTMANLSKSSTNAYVDGNNVFYAAESGLNKRAQELRQKFDVSLLPTGTDPASIPSCFPIAIPEGKSSSVYNADNDFECRNYRFQHGSSSATVKSIDGKGALGGATKVTNENDNVKYVAYTFVKPKQNYTINPPTPIRIPAGEPFAGLNVLEYKYTVNSTARKPSSIVLVSSTADASEIAAKSKKISGVATSLAEDGLAAAYDAKQAVADTKNANSSGTNTILQMDFKSRVVPLFQFAAFYENDLEMNSATEMSIGGPVHTNGNLKAISYNGSSLPTNVTVGTRFMDKVTVAMDVFNKTVHNNGGCGTSTNCGIVSVYKGSGAIGSAANYNLFPGYRTDNKLTAPEVAVFGDRLRSKVPRINPPKPGFLREKNYFTGETGLYYGKADIRLKFFPNRLFMPFNFTSIQDGAGCDLAANKIPIDRQHSSALTCTNLTKGQLHSLRQPVLTKSTSTTALSLKNQDILKALQVAIASSPTPITLSNLNTLTVTASGWGKVFKDQLSASPNITPLDITNLLPATSVGVTPPLPLPVCSASSLPTTGKAIDIASALCSKLLPAPIQLITGNTNSTNTTVNGGFYNQIQSLNDGSFSTTNGSWVQMLQMNIESLTYWNRDGIYVEADAGNKNDLKVAYAAPAALTLGSGLSTDNKAFIKAPADLTRPAGSFAFQGLAANDAGANATEAGLVLYANVSDDTNGDGTDEITAPNTNTAVSGKDARGNTIVRVDNHRSYPALPGIRKSPYGFVISGGNELPGPLTIATDQAAYIQGDYNNPGVVPGSLPQTTSYYPSNNPADDRGFRRQPAAIMADTLTFLSNECLNANRQVNCGINSTLVGSRAVVANGIAINAALVSNILQSTTSPNLFNGGLNKYMKHLENWGYSTALNYTGSMVSLGEPLESDRVAVNDNVYKRNYNYETRFDAFEKLPPLSPSAVYLQQQVFRRQF